MGTLASNLLMCTCAGAVGVAAVPVAKKVNLATARKPAVSRPVARSSAPKPIDIAKAADCQPLGITMAALAPIAGTSTPPQVDLPDLTGFASGAGDQMASLLPPPGTMGLAGMRRARSLNGNFLPAGGGGAGGIGGGSPDGGPEIVDVGDIVTNGPDFTDITTAVPEPGMWVIMVSGFGVVGIAMRARRSSTLAEA